MSIFKGFLVEFLRGLSSSKSRTMSEDEILKAIDALPDAAQETPADTKVEKKSNDWDKDTTWVQVPKPKCWSDFKYLGKPGFKGQFAVDGDDRIYFTIPCGFEWDQSVKFWFITFPLNCDDSEVKDFFTIVNPVEA